MHCFPNIHNLHQSFLHLCTNINSMIYRARDTITTIGIASFNAAQLHQRYHINFCLFKLFAFYAKIDSRVSRRAAGDMSTS